MYKEAKTEKIQTRSRTKFFFLSRRHFRSSIRDLSSALRVKYLGMLGQNPRQLDVDGHRYLTFGKRGQTDAK